jgi:hypothetical protein
MDMSRYDSLCNEYKSFLILLKEGYISNHFLAWKTIYENYLEEIKKDPRKMVIYQYLGEKYNLTATQVRNIVKFMS